MIFLPNVQFLSHWKYKSVKEVSYDLTSKWKWNLKSSTQESQYLKEKTTFNTKPSELIHDFSVNLAATTDLLSNFTFSSVDFKDKLN